MTHPVIRGDLALPSISIDDPRFVYINAASTDIRRTLAREHARLAALAQQGEAKSEKVLELRALTK